MIGETTVRPMDGAVEHPRMDWLRVDERMPWQTSKSGPMHSVLNSLSYKSLHLTIRAHFPMHFYPKALYVSLSNLLVTLVLKRQARELYKMAIRPCLQ
ncbi:hypothetical protein FAP94_06125 [Morganella morganii]|nr:hypothetical protein [Morganella morganii]